LSSEVVLSFGSVHVEVNDLSAKNLGCGSQVMLSKEHVTVTVTGD